MNAPAVVKANICRLSLAVSTVYRTIILSATQPEKEAVHILRR
jgi:hypothetical protein